MNGTGLVRGPSSRLAEGIVTHISRMPVDTELARSQHAAYADALAASGWTIRAAPAADDCPDSVFIEDTVVICEDLAVLTRPGAAVRRPEVEGVAQTVRSLGLHTACIEEPGTLDGGDVLQAGSTVYVGRGGRTNGEGIRQLRALLVPLGRTVIGVPPGDRGGRQSRRTARRRPRADRRVRSPHRRAPRGPGLHARRRGHQRVREA